MGKPNERSQAGDAGHTKGCNSLARWRVQSRGEEMERARRLVEGIELDQLVERTAKEGLPSFRDTVRLIIAQ